MRFTFLWLFAGLIVASIPGRVRATDAPGAPVNKPNVLFIAIDDLRDWVGFLGDKQVKTPNLDRLAKRGVVFTNSHCAAPVCNPSRTALMSGRRPSASGVYTNGNDWRPVISPEWTLTGTFRQAGDHVCGLRGTSPCMKRFSRNRAASSKRASPPRSRPSTACTCTSKSA